MHNTWLLVIPVSLLVAIDFHVRESIKTYRIYQSLSFKTPTAEQLPEEFDWRKIHAFPPVKDQQNCNSCWAFGTVGGVEAAYTQRYNESISLSEQELIDCNWDHTGCKHGWPIKNAIEYIALETLSSSQEYPQRENGKHGPCKKWQISKRRVYGHMTQNVTELEAERKIRKQRLRGLRYTDVPLDEGHMKAWIVNQGPLIATLDNVPDFDGQHDIMYPDSHAVVVVGYLKDKDGSTSLIMRNSWGTYSGYEGYVYQSLELGSQIIDLIGPYFKDDPLSWTNGNGDDQLSETGRYILQMMLIFTMVCLGFATEEKDENQELKRVKKKVNSKWVKRARNWQRRQQWIKYMAGKREN